MHVRYFGRKNLAITVAAVTLGAVVWSIWMPWWAGVGAAILTLALFAPGNSLRLRSHSLIWKAGAHVLRRIIYLGDLEQIESVRPPYLGLDSRSIQIASFLSDIACPGLVLIRERNGRVTPFCCPDPEAVAAQLEQSRTAALPLNMEAAARQFRRSYEERERSVAGAVFAAATVAVAYRSEPLVASIAALVCLFLLVRALHQHRAIARSSSGAAV